MTAQRYVKLVVTGAVVACTTWGAVPCARGHGLPPLPLALWGPFATPTVQCLRHLSQASQRCFSTALAAERACINAQLAGKACDQAQRDAAIAAARDAATATVDASCAGGQLLELRFANATDARADLLRACAEADSAVRQVYAAALNPITRPGLSSRDRSCLTQAGTLASKLINANLRNYSRVFDAAATLILPPSEKIGRYQDTAKRMGNARARMASHLEAACAGTAVCIGNAEALLGVFERRASCVLSAVYFHTSVSCPVPVCGDGIVDSGEQCDDGNGIDADGCRSDCTLD